MSYKEDKRLEQDLAKCKYKCTCGHTIIMTNRVNKTICSWCHNYVYKDKKEEFVEKLRKLRKNY